MKGTRTVFSEPELCLCLELSEYYQFVAECIKVVLPCSNSPPAVSQLSLLDLLS